MANQSLRILHHVTTAVQTNIATAITIRTSRSTEAAGVAKTQTPPMGQSMWNPDGLQAPHHRQGTTATTTSRPETGTAKTTTGLKG